MHMHMYMYMHMCMCMCMSCVRPWRASVDLAAVLPLPLCGMQAYIPVTSLRAYHLQLILLATYTYY